MLNLQRTRRDHRGEKWHALVTLRLKVIICVLVALVVSAGLIYGVSHVILLHEIEMIEADQMKSDLSVARRAIDRELAELDARVFDYGAWDDSYEFVVHPTQEFIDSNLPDNIYQSFKSTCSPMCAPTEPSLTAAFSTSRAKAERPIPSVTRDPLEPGGPLLSAAMAGNPLSGVVRTEAGTFLIASRPIILSDETGTPSGAVVMGRLLNEP